jgi:hypothetical protein
MSTEYRCSLCGVIIKKDDITCSNGHNIQKTGKTISVKLYDYIKTSGLVIIKKLEDITSNSTISEDDRANIEKLKKEMKLWVDNWELFIKNRENQK